MTWWKKLMGINDPDPPEPPPAPDIYSLMLSRHVRDLRTSSLTSFGFRFEPEAEKPPAVDADKLAALKDAEPYRVTERVPDMVECITAWRAWDVNVQKKAPRLEALGRSTIWKPRKIMTAVCIPNPNRLPMTPTPACHYAPSKDCECGVWAFKELDGLVSALGNKYNRVRVLGTVSLWGRVIETENGYRAQHAYPSELWLLDESLEELGLIYDVPVRLVKG